MTAAPRAVLFDLDDTLISTGRRPEVLQRIARTFTGELGALAPEVLAARLEADFEAYWSDPARHQAGRMALAETRREIVSATFASLANPVLTRDLAFAFADRLTAWRDEATTLFPGAIANLETLRRRGVRLGLITNGASATQRAKIERFALAAHFDHIQIEGEHGFGKPEPRAYLHALEVLDCQPPDAWIVGDNLVWEVEAPQRLGLFCIWFDHLAGGLPTGSAVRPDRIIAAHAELLV